MDCNWLEIRGNSWLIRYLMGLYFCNSPHLACKKDGGKISKWDLENTKRDVKTERFGMEFEQQAMGSLQLLALMRIITPVITLAYLREWRGRTSGCVYVWVGGYVRVCSCTWLMFVCVRARSCACLSFYLTRTLSLIPWISISLC